MQSKVLRETTPTRISQEMEKFCESMSPGEKPVFVPVKPQPHAIVDGCHVNVGEHVRSYGGKPVFGWLIWQSKVLLHAVFHCNWLTPDGEMVDITPKADREREILFVPDASVKWTGKTIPSQRQPRHDDPLLVRLVKLYEQRDRLMTKYRCGGPVGSFDANQVDFLNMEIGRLNYAIEMAWRKGSAPASRSVADRRARNKAERKRRKQQRRRK